MSVMNDVLDESKAAELVQQGITLYEKRLKSSLEPGFNGQVVAIHLDSGDYAIGRTSSIASRLLRQKRPDGLTLALDIGLVPVDDPLTLRMRGLIGRGSKA